MRKTCIVFSALCLLTTGCGGGLINQHGKEFDTLNSLAMRAAASLGSGNVGQYQVGAHGINPGVRLSAGVEYYAEARYVGLAGQMQAAAQGTFNRELSAEEMNALIQVSTAQYRSDEEKRAAIHAFLQSIGKRIEAERLNLNGGDQAPLPGS